jgi:hypothetical protein
VQAQYEQRKVQPSTSRRLEDIFHLVHSALPLTPLTRRPLKLLELLIVEGQQKIARHHFMVLQEYWTEVVMTTPVLDLADTVRMCRLKSLHRNKDGTEMKKIYFRFESIDLDKAFRAGLRSFGLSELTGAPPKGEMAKAIQRFLDTEFFR